MPLSRALSMTSFEKRYSSTASPASNTWSTVALSSSTARSIAAELQCTSDMIPRSTHTTLPARYANAALEWSRAHAPQSQERRELRRGAERGSAEPQYVVGRLASGEFHLAGARPVERLARDGPD